MSKLLTAVFVFGLFINSAVANEPEITANNLREIGRIYFSALKSSGIDRVSGVSIEKIQDVVETIKIEMQGEVNVPSKSTSPAIRRTAYWEPNTRTIYVSALHIRRTNPQSIPGIMAHEFYRAADIYDEDYNVSALTNHYVKTIQLREQNPWIVKNNETFEALKSLIEGPSKRLFADGGSSGVGGGGDIRSLEFKETVLAELFFDFDRRLISRTQFLAATKALRRLKVELSILQFPGTFSFDRNADTLLIPLDWSGTYYDLNFETIVLPLAKLLLSVKE